MTNFVIILLLLSLVLMVNTQFLTKKEYEEQQSTLDGNNLPILNPLEALEEEVGITYHFAVYFMLLHNHDCMTA
jgi:hypothetical protein